MILKTLKLEANFTIYSNELIFNRKIPYIASKILIELLARPENWEVRKSQFVEEYAGEWMIDKAFKQLQELGYLKIIDIRDKTTGRILNRTWLASPVPITDTIISELNTRNSMFKLTVSSKLKAGNSGVKSTDSCNDDFDTPNATTEGFELNTGISSVKGNPGLQIKDSIINNIHSEYQDPDIKDDLKIQNKKILKNKEKDIVASKNEATASPEPILKICPKCKKKPELLAVNGHLHCPECLRNYDQDLKIIKPKIEKETPDPRVKEILEFHYANNPEKSEDGIENWGRDSKLIKNLIGQFRPEKQPEAKEIVITYLKNYYTFQFYQKVCYSIPAFVNNFKTFRRSEKENEKNSGGNTEKFINLRGSWEPTMEGFHWSIEN